MDRTAHRGGKRPLADPAPRKNHQVIIVPLPQWQNALHEARFKDQTPKDFRATVDILAD